jgi:uncharacterized protein (UPF0335 family)
MDENDDIKELAERLYRLENEIKLLQLDKKELFQEFKDRVDLKTFRAAWQIIKKRKELNCDALDDLIKVLED